MATAAASGGGPFQVDVTSEEAYKEVLKASHAALQVVELYQQWCGPTKAVITTFKRFLLDNPAADVKFYTVCVNKVPALSRFEGKSEPAFIFIKDGKVLEEVVGVQLPKLTRLMQTLSAAGGSAAVVHSSSTEE